jgi:hypothetical protein
MSDTLQEAYEVLRKSVESKFYGEVSFIIGDGCGTYARFAQT